MSYSYSVSEATTFTVTHAKYMASKVATDLKRLQRLYGLPSDSDITAYETEMTELLKNGYLETVTYGFKRDGNWIEPALLYIAHDLLSSSSDDDDPGKVRPGADISGAKFSSYLTYSSAWNKLSLSEQEEFEKHLPFKRVGASAPGVDGYFNSDRSYSAGGMSLDRSSVRNFK